MGSRWYNLAVIILWLAAMTWLVSRKVIPDWLVGDPPDYRSIVEAQREQQPVGWWFSCRNGDNNETRLGWALCQTIGEAHGPKSIESRVRFDAMGVLESRSLLGDWMRGMVHSELIVETLSVVRVDGLGNLIDFDSSLSFENEVWGRLRGEVIADGGMHLTISGAKLPQAIEKTIALPKQALLGDALSPQTLLPKLRAGQTWSVPLYNPLQPSQGMEMLRAEVEGSEPFAWEGAAVPVWRVVFRSDPGYGAGRSHAPRGQMWVRHDGTVVKQETTFLDLTLMFTRMTRDETQRLEEKWQKPRDKRGRRPADERKELEKSTASPVTDAR